MLARMLRDVPRLLRAACHGLAAAPFVCNGCDRKAKCPLPKKLYVAEGAQARYRGALVASRSGIHPDDAAVAEMNAVLSPCLRRGQSVGNVIRTNPAVFGGYAESTVYGWVNDGLFDAGRADLPFAMGRRRPHRRPQTKTDARCRVGRTFLDLHEWLKVNPGVVPCELDTVIGSVGGKVLFTMIFPGSGLALAFLRDARTSQTCTRLFNMLWECAGARLFRRLFAAVLTDNGTEFSDPGMIENFRPDPEHNPARLEPRGVKVFYCDPYCSSQKPHIERAHIDMRRILQKGVSFNPLSQAHVNLMISHVNSFTRDALYDRFTRMYGADGKAFLDRLGIVRVPANDVTLHPFLLGQRFQHAADRATLRKNGMTGGQDAPAK